MNGALFGLVSVCRDGQKKKGATVCGLTVCSSGSLFERRSGTGYRRSPAVKGAEKHHEYVDAQTRTLRRNTRAHGREKRQAHEDRSTHAQKRNSQVKKEMVPTITRVHAPTAKHRRVCRAEYEATVNEESNHKEIHAHAHEKNTERHNTPTTVSSRELK